MKLSIKTLIITSILVSIFPLFSNAQNSAQTKQKYSYLKTIDSVINRGFKSAVLKDSISLYAINFRIDLTKNNAGKIEVSQIVANDSLAYKLFPSYKRFYSIDYNSLLGVRKKIRLIVPILIANISETAKKTYKKEDGSSLIDIQSAINTAYSLYSTISYNNLKEAEIPVEHRIQKSKMDTNNDRTSKDIVYLNPYIVQIVNIK
ncbi:hypothetical protein H7F33_10220 [Pedobacter sp. PAMC26386]|nr:hypothetical protein H7F33_10220 [Pedobacter sp. PAMC26386]